MPVDADAVRRWFDEYFDVFAACARGDREISALLKSYGVPLIVTSDEGVITLMTDDEAAAVIQSQIDGLRAMGYHHGRAALRSDRSQCDGGSVPLYVVTPQRG